MRRHIVQTFGSMDVALAIFRCYLVEKAFQIRLDIGVGVLLNEERGGGMAAENRQKAGRDLLLGHPGGHQRRDLDKTFALGLNIQEMERLAHRNVTCWKRWRCGRLVRRCAAGRKRTASKPQGSAFLRQRARNASIKTHSFRKGT